MNRRFVRLTLLTFCVTLFPCFSYAAVSVSSPVGGRTYSNPVKVMASAKESVSVRQMQVWDNGKKLGYYTGSSVNVSYTLSNGAHKITVEDLGTRFNVIHKSAVNITVAPATSTGITLTSPVSGMSYSGAVKVVASAKESVTVRQMQVWDNGKKLGYYSGSDVNASYDLSSGAHRITVEDLNSSDSVIHKAVVNISVASQPTVPMISISNVEITDASNGAVVQTLSSSSQINLAALPAAYNLVVVPSSGSVSKIEYNSPTQALTLSASPYIVCSSSTCGFQAGDSYSASAQAFNSAGVGGPIYPIQISVITPPTAKAPVFNPAGGMYSGSQKVTLKDSTAGATLYYTVNGSAPTKSSTKYTGPITVSGSEKVRAIAYASGYTASPISGETYTITDGGPVFSPSGGTYGSPQTVTMSGCKSGQSIFYTTNGYSPTIASTLYTGPVTVSSNTTLKAICATAITQQHSQSSSKGFACHTAHGGTWGSLTCSSSGGVASNNPKNITMQFGSPAKETITPISTASGETQALWTWFTGGNADPTGAICDNCTEEVQDLIIRPTVGSSVIANNEMDMPQYDATHGVNRQNGLQCNQQAGIMQWQVDSGNAGGWHNTGITDGCPLSTTAPTEVVLEVDHINGDTGCGGHGCAYYKKLCINGNCHALAGNYNGTQGYHAQSGQHAWGRQDQIDIKGGLGSSPVAGRIIYQANVSLGMHDESPISSASYSF